MVSTSAAYRLRMLLAVLAGTVVGLDVLAVVLVIGAMTAGAPPEDGADWGAVYRPPRPPAAKRRTLRDRVGPRLGAREGGRGWRCRRCTSGPVARRRWSG